MAFSGVSQGEFQGKAGGGKRYLFAFGIVTAFFFAFGFLTCLNDILVPHLKALFTLDYTRAALIQFCFFTAYFLASLPSGKLVSKLGYKRGTILGALIAAFGCLLFYPAAGMQSYDIFLVGLFILGSGITLIQVAVNPYITILGPSETASSRLNLAQAFNSLGTMIAPIFGSYVILAVAAKSGTELQSLSEAARQAYKAAQAASVQGPYVWLAVAMIVLAAIVGFSHLPEGSLEKDSTRETAASAKKAATRKSAWHYRHLVLGALGIFFYVGAEVAIGSYLVNFMGLQDIVSMPEARAARYVSFYWGGAMIGRFIGSWVLRKIRPNRVLAFNALVASILVVLAMILTGHVAMWAILAIGLFNSIMFPTIFTLAIDGLGEHTAQGSGILCMAIVGGAAIPLLQGMMADTMGLHHSYLLPVACYLYIAYYGWKGYRADGVASGVTTLAEPAAV